MSIPPLLHRSFFSSSSSPRMSLLSTPLGDAKLAAASPHLPSQLWPHSYHLSLPTLLRISSFSTFYIKGALFELPRCHRLWCLNVCHLLCYHLLPLSWSSWNLALPLPNHCQPRLHYYYRRYPRRSLSPSPGQQFPRDLANPEATCMWPPLDYSPNLSRVKEMDENFKSQDWRLQNTRVSFIFNVEKKSTNSFSMSKETIFFPHN